MQNSRGPARGWLPGPERRQRIAEHVLSQGQASAAQLAEMFRVSLMTVHRDLDELERHGIVRKHRGGVTAQPATVFESDIAFRMATCKAEKAAIARHVRPIVEPGMSVMLDDSTTAFALARLLGEVTPLTVVTNSLETIGLVAQMRGVRLVALGGDYHPSYGAFLGAGCVAAVEALHSDLLVVSVSGVHGGYALQPEPESVLVKRAMLRSSTSRVLLVDHTKLGRTALHRVSDLSGFDRVVVDGRASDDALRQLRDQHQRVEVAQL